MLLPVNPQEASALLDRLETQHQEIPEIVFAPRPETYILTFRNFNKNNEPNYSQKIKQR